MPRLPDWTDSLRPHQTEAIEEILDAFTRVRLVVLDGPTGAGKTLIGDMVRQHLMEAGRIKKANYVCSDKGLQAQYLHDFPDSRVVMGRANYLPTKFIEENPMDITCADCAGPTCRYCEGGPKACPYILAREAARNAETAVLNTPYHLLCPSPFYKAREEKGVPVPTLTILDEADTVEDWLLSYAEVRITKKMVKPYGVNALPNVNAHWVKVDAWMKDVKAVVNVRVTELLSLEQAARDGHGPDLSDEQRKELKSGQSLLFSLNTYLTTPNSPDHPWVREMWQGSHGAASMTLKPVLVGKFGKRTLWNHGGLFLLMSATPIDPGTMVREIGWEGDYETVTCPMTFPDGNRPIVKALVGSMSNKATKEDPTIVPRMVEACRRILALPQHEGESVLIHAVSKQRAEDIARGLEGCGRKVIRYGAGEREQAVEEFVAHKGAVIVAQSLDRGVDFSGDLCRVVILAKVPHGYLGDKRIKARLGMDRGQTWYDTQTIRRIVQSTGRAVRSGSDTATSYILDSDIETLLRNRHGMFPEWWTRVCRTDLRLTQELTAPAEETQ